MFSKLLKYDFRAIKKYALPMLFILAIMTVIGMFNSWMLGSMIDRTPQSTFDTLLLISSVIFEFLIVFGFWGILIAIVVLTMVHFYKSLVTDEGYLTFTLPVRASEILSAKLLNALIWEAIIAVAVAAGMCLTFSTIMLPFPHVWKEIFSGLTYALQSLKEMFGASLWLTLLLGTLVTVANAVNSILLYYMVIFFASVIAKKNKVIVAIACILGANILYGVVTSFISTMLSLMTIPYDVDATVAQMNIRLTLSFVLLSAASLGFYFLTKYMMEKKLNLP